MAPNSIHVDGVSGSEIVTLSQRDEAERKESESYCVNIVFATEQDGWDQNRDVR